MFVETQPAQEWLSPQEVAIKLGVSTDTIYRMISDGDLVATRLRRRWCINRRSLERRLEENSNRKKDELGAS